MNLRCFYCQTPFTLGRAEVLAALQQMDADNMNHYDAHCPRCRRANSVSRQRLEMFLPNWREAAAEQVNESAVPAAPATDLAPAPAVALPSAEESAQLPKTHHRKRAGSAKKVVAKPAPKAASKGKKPAATKAKPAPVKSTTKKTTTKSKSK